MKSLRAGIAFVVTCFVVSFALGFLSGYLEARGERPISPSSRLMMALGAGGVVAAIVSTIGGNRRVAQATREQAKAAKSFTPIADRGVVYVFRDSFIGHRLGINVLLDAAMIGQTRGNTFYRLEVAPGDHVLASHNPQNDSKNEQRFHAAAGAMLFFEQTVKMGMTASSVNLVATDRAPATRRIQKCRLLLPERASAS
jgi:hypothetical protein